MLLCFMLCVFTGGGGDVCACLCSLVVCFCACLLVCLRLVCMCAACSVYLIVLSAC